LTLETCPCFTCRIRRYFRAGKSTHTLSEVADLLAAAQVEMTFPLSLAAFKQNVEGRLREHGFSRKQAVTAVSIIIAALAENSA
jgi:hypothetical protein